MQVPHRQDYVTFAFSCYQASPRNQYQAIIADPLCEEKEMKKSQSITSTQSLHSISVSTEVQET